MTIEVVLEGRSVADLEDLIERAHKALDEAKKRRRVELKERFKILAAEEGLTLDEVLGAGSTTDKRKSAAPKYRNPETGDAWAGRGRKPKWIVAHLEAGGNLEDFAIK